MANHNFLLDFLDKNPNILCCQNFVWVECYNLASAFTTHFESDSRNFLNGVVELKPRLLCRHTHLDLYKTLRADPELLLGRCGVRNFLRLYI